MMPATKKFKVDIFEVLGKLSTKDRDYYKSLTEEEQKALSPLVLMRWLSGTSDPRQVVFLNELVNPMVFNLSKHKELAMDLLLASTSGRGQRYKWMKMEKKKVSFPNLVKLVKEYFDYSTTHAVETLPLLSDEDLLSYSEQLGYQPDDIKLIKKEIRARGKL